MRSTVVFVAVDDPDDLGVDLALCLLDVIPCYHVVQPASLVELRAVSRSGWMPDDVVVVPGVAAVRQPASQLAPVLTDARARGARLIGLAKGVFTLAAAGLLDDRFATTHWEDAADFRAKFPRVRHRPDALFVEDENVFTCGGRLATLDLLVSLVEHDLGAAAAATVARLLLMGPTRAAAQWPVGPGLGEPGRDELGGLLAWMIENLERPMTLELIAARMHLSPRTLLRRFHGSVGMSPHQWLMQQRMVKARVLLETTDLLVDRVAACCGFRSPGNFRAQFASASGLSPTQYRRRMRRRVG